MYIISAGNLYYRLSDIKYLFVDASTSSASSTTDAGSKSEAQSLAGPTGNDSTRATDEQQCYGYGCGCRKKCTFQSFLKGGCPTPIPTRSSFLYLNTKGLTENQQAILKGRLYADFEKINSQFNSLVTRTWKSLRHEGVTAKQLVRTLLMLDAFQPTKPAKPLLGECIEDLNRCAELNDVLMILRCYISFFSHEIIDIIINELGTPEDQKRLHEYIAKLDEYSKRYIFECPMYSPVRPDQATLIFKADGIDSKTYNIKHIQKFQSCISNIMGVAQHSLRLCTIDEGCLQFTFQMPHFMKDIFPLTDSQSTALRDAGVTCLTCGDYKCFCKVRSL